eukprot:5008791-Alexandrium_andersonii.AAC.1
MLCLSRCIGQDRGIRDRRCWLREHPWWQQVGKRALVGPLPVCHQLLRLERLERCVEGLLL